MPSSMSISLGCPGWLILIAALLPAAFGVGCTIPVAVFPWPTPGGGKELTFVDEQGSAVLDDGLMLVSRREYFSACLIGFEGSPSNHVVRVHQGRARVPHDWTLASISLTSAEIGLGYGTMGLDEMPIPSSIVILESIPPIYPITNPMTNEFYIFTLVPGYHVLSWDDPSQGRIRDIDKFRLMSEGGSTIRLRKNADHPCDAWEYWRDCLERLRRRYDQGYESGPDLRLETDDYFRVKAFIERELASIQMPPPATQPTE